MSKRSELRDRIIPALANALQGSGGIHLDTDVLDLSNERDAHYIALLANVAAGIVLADRAGEL